MKSRGCGCLQHSLQILRYRYTGSMHLLGLVMGICSCTILILIKLDSTTITTKEVSSQGEQSAVGRGLKGTDSMECNYWDTPLACEIRSLHAIRDRL